MNPDQEALPMSERRVNHHTRELFEGLRQDLLCRLASVCDHFAQSELMDLTSRMLRLQIKYDAVTAVPLKSKCSDVRRDDPSDYRPLPA
jgi:hypothetical protein